MRAGSPGEAIWLMPALDKIALAYSFKISRAARTALSFASKFSEILSTAEISPELTGRGGLKFKTDGEIFIKILFKICLL